jgi:hypothetical protein
VSNVYEAFTLGDRTLTGKILGDFTIDFCKTLAGAAVSQTGITLTELGVGKYVLMNPNITVRSVISGYLTADSTKSFSVMMDPVDGDIAKESTLDAGVTVNPAQFGAGVLQGKVTVTNGETIRRTRGDFVPQGTILFAFGTDWDCTGRNVYFCVKSTATGAKLLDLLCVLSDPATGSPDRADFRPMRSERPLHAGT